MEKHYHIEGKLLADSYSRKLIAKVSDENLAKEIIKIAVRTGIWFELEISERDY